jgi:hypothetical protein
LDFLYDPRETILQTLLNREDLNEWVIFRVSTVGLRVIIIVFDILTMEYTWSSTKYLASYELWKRSFELSLAIGRLPKATAI